MVISGVYPPLYPCTVFYATDGNTILGGNNEDWSDSKTKIWFFPPEEGKHGWVKFGFAGGFPQGGLNDQGLFWDATGCAYLEMPYSEANKEKYYGPLMEKVIEECASVQEALIVFENYYCDDQYKAQYLIGDATGASMIVEGDSIIMKNGDYQVATNFYHSEPVMVAILHSFTLNGTLCCSFILGIILMRGISRKKKKPYLFIVTILVIFLVFFSCKDEITAPSPTQINKISRTIENLESNMTYFWKVVAYPEGNNDFSSESIVQTFTTED